jgi:hypothetical protein
MTRSTWKAPTPITERDKEAAIEWFKVQEDKWRKGANDLRYSERTRLICRKNADGYRANIQRLESK